MKGQFFSIEVAFALTAVFIVLAALVSFTATVETPNYDLLSSAVVAHDMGEGSTPLPPPGFATVCSDHAAVLPYYDYGGTPTEVCVE